MEKVTKSLNPLIGTFSKILFSVKSLKISQKEKSPLRNLGTRPVSSAPV